MENTFKVGDTVKIREDLKVDTCFGMLYVNPTMASRKGKEYKVVQVAYDNYFGVNIYKLDEEGTKWNWCEEMFEMYEEEY